MLGIPIGFIPIGFLPIRFIGPLGLYPLGLYPLGCISFQTNISGSTCTIMSGILVFSVYLLLSYHLYFVIYKGKRSNDRLWKVPIKEWTYFLYFQYYLSHLGTSFHFVTMGDIISDNLGYLEISKKILRRIVNIWNVLLFGYIFPILCIFEMVIGNYTLKSVYLSNSGGSK